MEPIIKTEKGRIRGIETANAYVFRGVPYAKPPLGSLRFHAPEPPDAWEGVFEAKSLPPMSMQKREKDGSFYHREFFNYPDWPLEMSEDCLYLNIWTPKDCTAPCPVAIWYHGGGFVNGSASEIEFDGEGYARRGVILVTVGYRLGMLGYFCHPAFADKEGLSGNYGLLDQIAAIDWVRENIAAFGGDPDCITIFGQSAGGMAVRDLVCSPRVKGKIHRAIIQSCNGYHGPIKPDFPMKKMQKISERFLKRKKLTPEALMTLSEQEIVDLTFAYNLFAGFWTREGLSLTPVIDGSILPESPDLMIEKGQTARIPYMTGSTKNDMGTGKAGVGNPKKSKIHQSLLRWSAIHTQQGIPSYSYYFMRDLPGDRSGAFHSSELWYTFGTLGRSWRPMEAHDYELSERMMDIWTRFIKTGDPGWEPCSGETGYFQELK